MRLLVVETQRMWADALAAFLDSQSDIDVVGAAHCAADALELAVRHRPHVVTTSDRLPDGDGANLVGKLRGQHSDARVIMVSAFEDEEAAAAAMEAGCSGFVPKSARMSDVAAAARTVVAGRVAIPPTLVTRVPPKEPRRQGTRLTATELDILRLFPEGLPSAAIGGKLGLSERSVRNHVQSILTKLESHSKLEGLAAAIRRGIIFLTFL